MRAILEKKKTFNKTFLILGHLKQEVEESQNCSAGLAYVFTNFYIMESWIDRRRVIFISK
jgi:hypothetical protein